MNALAIVTACGDSTVVTASNAQSSVATGNPPINGPGTQPGPPDGIGRIPLLTEGRAGDGAWDRRAAL